ncbi:MAG: hypothetical protein C0623_07280, partial [Desulfuromonas sp.]
MAFQNFKVGSRLGMGFAIVLSLMILTTAVTFWSLNHVESDTDTVISESLPFTLKADQMVISTHEIQQLLTDAAATKDVGSIAAIKPEVSSFKQNLAAFKDMFAQENDTAHVREIEEMEAAFDEFIATGTRMANAYINEGQAAGNVIMVEFDEDSEALAKHVTDLQQDQVAEIRQNGSDILSSSQQVKNLQVVLGVIALLIGIGITVLITRSIVKPLETAVDTARRMAVGDLGMKIDVSSTDETGILLGAMKEMVDANRDVARTADRIAGGDLGVKITPRSGEDTLLKALASMVGNLT